MSSYYQSNAYKQASHNTSKIRQVILMYEAIMRAIYTAHASILQGKNEQRYHSLEKANSLILAMDAILDHEKAPDISKILSNFYKNIQAQIASIHVSKDASLCENINVQLRIMLDSWKEIERQQTQEESYMEHDKKLENIHATTTFSA